MLKRRCWVCNTPLSTARPEAAQATHRPSGTYRCNAALGVHCRQGGGRRGGVSERVEVQHSQHFPPCTTHVGSCASQQGRVLPAWGGGLCWLLATPARSMPPHLPGPLPACRLSESTPRVLVGNPALHRVSLGMDLTSLSSGLSTEPPHSGNLLEVCLLSRQHSGERARDSESGSRSPSHSRVLEELEGAAELRRLAKLTLSLSNV